MKLWDRLKERHWNGKPFSYKTANTVSVGFKYPRLRRAWLWLLRDLQRSPSLLKTLGALVGVIGALLTIASFFRRT